MSVAPNVKLNKKPESVVDPTNLISDSKHESSHSVLLDSNEYRIVDNVIYKKFGVFKSAFNIDINN